MQDFKNKLTGIRKALEQQLSHPYLQQFIASPPIDEDKLMMLASLLDSIGVDESRTEKYTVTAMLLQIALDTHELVKVSRPGSSEWDLKERQLTVLAGVYYSGLYYKLLAAAGEIELIDMLASGVKTVNENKIIIYQKEADAIEILMDSVKEVEAALVGKVADFCNAGIWRELAANVLFVKRLIDEERLFLETGNSIVFDGLKKLSFPKMEQGLQSLSREQRKHLISVCERYREFAINSIKKAQTHLPGMNATLNERLESILGQHQSMVNFFVEEG
ncbi:heptaprenyl diphosphate synthase component 1 [Mesobacillus zeae]|uniref:heptaprenyl diphosphate synthase component 1 n=1 Tax=Mesobacillus zeae TaxID=1917180 RepID=UPI00300B4993